MGLNGIIAEESPSFRPRRGRASLNDTRVFWIAAVAILIQAASSILTVVVLLCLPAGLLAPRPPGSPGSPRGRAAWLVRNGLGWLVIGIGLALSLPILPGPGTLLVVLGFIIIDYPGKEGLRARLFGSRRLGRMVNGVRRFFGRPPLPFEAAPADRGPRL